MSIADLLERVDPVQFHGANRGKTIQEVNDILHGRSDMSISMLHNLLDDKCGAYDAEQVAQIQSDIRAFCHQKGLRTWRYTMTGSETYPYEMWEYDPKHPLKIIDQKIFDHAAEHGFPPDFFKNSYFDHVTIYCMPDKADCSFSTFESCGFSVCGIRGAVFDHADIHRTDFRSSLLHMVNFTGASIAHSHFRDSDLISVSFQDARLRGCLTLDCTLDHVDFRGAVLNGSSYGRIAAHAIQNLRDATITQGGATREEVGRLHVAIFRELGIPLFSTKQQCTGERQKNHPSR